MSWRTGLYIFTLSIFLGEGERTRRLERGFWTFPSHSHLEHLDLDRDWGVGEEDRRRFFQ